jgi:hypothetical protein
MKPVCRFTSSVIRALPMAMLLTLAATNARAQASGADQAAAAEALFDEGRKLMQEHSYAQACAKFAESQRLDAGVGTLIYLGDCYEKAGRLASSWVTFREAAAAARAAGQAEREKLARDRASQLEPRLAKLVIDVPEEARLPGLEVRRRETSLGPALWGSALPVDAGSYTIHASAPGHQPWSSRVEINDGAAPVRVEVPLLNPEPTTASSGQAAAQPVSGGPSAPGTAPDSPAGQTQRTAGYVIAGVGVLAAGAGVFFWQRSVSKHDQALARCTPNCNDEARSLQEQAETSSTISNVGLIGGTALIVGGVVLVLTAPSSKREAKIGLGAMNVTGSVAPSVRVTASW